jgi:hypothetical protein
LSRFESALGPIPDEAFENDPGMPKDPREFWPEDELEALFEMLDLLLLLVELKSRS